MQASELSQFFSIFILHLSMTEEETYITTKTRYQKRSPWNIIFMAVNTVEVSEISSHYINQAQKVTNYLTLTNQSGQNSAVSSLFQH